MWFFVQTNSHKGFWHLSPSHWLKFLEQITIKQKVRAVLKCPGSEIPWSGAVPVGCPKSPKICSRGTKTDFKDWAKKLEESKKIIIWTPNHTHGWAIVSKQHSYIYIAYTGTASHWQDGKYSVDRIWNITLVLRLGCFSETVKSFRLQRQFYRKREGSHQPQLPIHPLHQGPGGEAIPHRAGPFHIFQSLKEIYLCR